MHLDVSSMISEAVEDQDNVDAPWYDRVEGYQQVARCSSNQRTCSDKSVNEDPFRLTNQATRTGLPGTGFPAAGFCLHCVKFPLTHSLCLNFLFRYFLVSALLFYICSDYFVQYAFFPKLQSGPDNQHGRLLDPRASLSAFSVRQRASVGCSRTTAAPARQPCRRYPVVFISDIGFSSTDRASYLTGDAVLAGPNTTLVRLRSRLAPSKKKWAPSSTGASRAAPSVAETNRCPRPLCRRYPLVFIRDLGFSSKDRTSYPSGNVVLAGPNTALVGPPLTACPLQKSFGCLLVQALRVLRRGRNQSLPPPCRRYPVVFISDLGFSSTDRTSYPSGNAVLAGPNTALVGLRSWLAPSKKVFSFFVSRCGWIRASLLSTSHAFSPPLSPYHLGLP